MDLMEWQRKLRPKVQKYMNLLSNNQKLRRLPTNTRRSRRQLQRRLPPNSPYMRNKSQKQRPRTTIWRKPNKSQKCSKCWINGTELYLAIWEIDQWLKKPLSPNVFINLSFLYQLSRLFWTLVYSLHFIDYYFCIDFCVKWFEIYENNTYFNIFSSQSIPKIIDSLIYSLRKQLMNFLQTIDTNIS